MNDVNKEVPALLSIQKLGLFQMGIHSNAVDKGFWEEGTSRNKGEMVMLMISELSECMEAHRINKMTSVLDAAWMESSTDFSHLYDEHFPDKIKNTIEDEVADVVIRILDYTAGWQIPIVIREYRKESTGNFANDLLRIVHYCLCAYHEDEAKDWGYVLASIQQFCIWRKIDIENHIKWKMVYNSRRPYKHNKRY